MKDKIVIYGAGDVGKLAYFYYSGRCEILCFIDGNSLLWGKRQFDIPIYEPDCLSSLGDVKIVLAIRRNKEIIQKQLFDKFGLSRCISFDVLEEVVEVCGEKNEETEDEVIIEYEGGLGNQMFQYAFGRCFKKKGVKVTADTTTYYLIGRRKFVLDSIFRNIDVTPVDIAKKNKYRKESLVFCEQNIYESCVKEADLDMLKLSKGYFMGYWQSSKYVSLVEQELREEFCFPDVKEDKLNILSDQIRNQCSVAVHVRRGDYLERKTQELMGDICTMEYYQKAFEYMLERIPEAKFYFFSEDIEWCRNHFNNLDAVFVDRMMFDEYEDWYDMYLMSACRHNIIANSSFSWWGAWLNNTNDKVVIAPKKWLNCCEIVDICPSDWILM